MARLKRYGWRIGQARKSMRSFISEASDAYHFWCFHLECRFVQTWPIRAIAWLYSMRVPRSADFGRFRGNCRENATEQSPGFICTTSRIPHRMWSTNPEREQFGRYTQCKFSGEYAQCNLTIVPTMTAKKLDTLLRRTGEFHEAVNTHIGGLVPFEGKRYLVSFQAVLLSQEHAAGALVLIKSGLYPSAFTLMRPQYESLVRAIWLLYTASDAWVEKLGESLSLENSKRAKEGLMLAEMLKELEVCAKAPGPIVEQLKQYRDVTWKALNSYTHGGLHPLSRTLSGYPAQLSYDVARNSNAIVALAAQLAAILSGDPRNMDAIRRFHIEYADCIPILTVGESSS